MSGPILKALIGGLKLYTGTVPIYSQLYLGSTEIFWQTRRPGLLISDFGAQQCGHHHDELF